MNKLPRPFYKWFTYKGHVGIDYPEPDDAMTKASGNGRVTFSGEYPGNAAGYGVTILYDNGQEHKYKHSDRNDWRIASGSRVALGTNIMEIGASGLATGPHLHHEVFINGVIQMGENYWKYVDQSPNAYVGAPNFSGEENEVLSNEDKKWIRDLVNGIPNKTVNTVVGANTEHSVQGRMGDVIGLTAARAGKAATRSAAILAIIQSSGSGEIDTAAILSALKELPVEVIKELKNAL